MSDRTRGQAKFGLDYWILNYSFAPFHRAGLTFRDYAPALFLGALAAIEHPGRPLDEILGRLQARYPEIRGQSALEWPQTLPVIRAAWERARSEPAA